MHSYIVLDKEYVNFHKTYIKIWSSSIQAIVYMIYKIIHKGYVHTCIKSENYSIRIGRKLFIKDDWSGIHILLKQEMKVCIYDYMLSKSTFLTNIYKHLRMIVFTATSNSNLSFGFFKNPLYTHPKLPVG